IRVAVVVGDGVGRRIRVGAADRLQAAVAGDGDGAVVGWGGVEHRVPPPQGVLGEGGASGLPPGVAPPSRVRGGAGGDGLALRPLVRVRLAVAQRSEGPISSASISVTWWLVPSGTVQVRCLGRPATITRAPLVRVSAALVAWSRQTVTVWKLVSPSVQLPSSWRVRGVTARRRLATSRPVGVERSSGSAVRLPTRVTRSVSDMGPSLGLGGALLGPAAGSGGRLGSRGRGGRHHLLRGCWGRMVRSMAPPWRWPAGVAPSFGPGTPRRVKRGLAQRSRHWIDRRRRRLRGPSCLGGRLRRRGGAQDGRTQAGGKKGEDRQGGARGGGGWHRRGGHRQGKKTVRPGRRGPRPPARRQRSVMAHPPQVGD